MNSNDIISLNEIVSTAYVEGDMITSETEIIAALNSCISTINGYLSTELPLINELEWLSQFGSADGYKYMVCTNPVANNYLVKNVFYPFIVAHFKRQSEQTNAYSIMYNNFNEALANFKSRYLSMLKKEYAPELNKTDIYTEQENDYEQSFSFDKRDY